MLTLKDREWKEFHHDKILKNYHGKRLNKEDRIIGSMPMLTASAENQGVSAFICNESMERYNDCITIDMFGHTFYHPYECTGDDNIYFFVNDSISSNAKKFIATCMNNNSAKFSYGKQFRQRNADKEIVMLPVDEDGEIDYEFMDAFVQEQEDELIRLYTQYLKEEKKKLGEMVELPSLEQKEWHDFFVTDFFSPPKRGKRIISKNYEEGLTPIVSSAGGNNGVIAFAGNEENVRVYENCLSVANGGVSAGYAFYHPYKYIATDHVTHFKGAKLNKFHYLFIGTVIRNQMHEKYDFSREMTDPRLKREKLLLPVDESGNPDFDYMEQYMKNIMISKYKAYLKYKTK